jgi:hypothetical protein
VIARLPFVLALAGLLGPAWATSGRADDCDDAQAAVEQYLKDQYEPAATRSTASPTRSSAGRSPTWSSSRSSSASTRLPY